MKRILRGGLAFGLATIGSVALAAPSLAAPAEPAGWEQLEGELSAVVVGPGEGITAASVDPCPVGEMIHWYMGREEEEGPRVDDLAPVDGDGHWSVDFTAPEDLGDFVFIAVCGDEVPEPADDALIEVQEGPDIDLKDTEGDDEEPPVYFYELPFTVAEPGTPTTTVPIDATAPPAVAVVAQPDFTG
jgi:hypothetical protein